MTAVTKLSDMPGHGVAGKLWEASHIRSSVIRALVVGHGYSQRSIPALLTQWEVPPVTGLGAWSRNQIAGHLKRWETNRAKGDKRAADHSRRTVEWLKELVTTEDEKALKWSHNNPEVEGVEDWRWEALWELAVSRDPFNWTEEELTRTTELASLMRGN